MADALKINSDVVGEIISRFKSGNVDLPVLPDIAIKVYNICEKENFSINELVKVIETDTTITTKLLSVSNSPRYKTVSETETLKNAINKIGVKTTRNLVFTISNRNVFKAKNGSLKTLLEQVWEHSYATGVCSRLVAEAVKHPSPENMFTYGLLHDVGKLLFISMIDDMLDEKDKVDEYSVSQTIDQMHCDFGAALLSKWKFSESFRTIALCHHDMSKASWKTRELLIVHFSNILVRDIGFSLKPAGEGSLEEVESAEALGLTKRKIISIADKVQDSVSEIMSVF